MQLVHAAYITDIQLCVTDGSTPVLFSLHNIFSEHNFTQYVKDRLVKTAYGNFYRNASYDFASQVFELDKADLCKRASCQRLIFENKDCQPIALAEPLIP